MGSKDQLTNVGDGSSGLIGERDGCKEEAISTRRGITRESRYFSFAPAKTGDIETRAPEGLGARVFDAV
jgi:hypothetical protein